MRNICEARAICITAMYAHVCPRLKCACCHGQQKDAQEGVCVCDGDFFFVSTFLFLVADGKAMARGGEMAAPCDHAAQQDPSAR